MKNKYNLDLINSYIEKGLIKKQNHPKLNIAIYNYTDKCVYDKAWDNITSNFRGLILDNSWLLIARSFNKFFNLEQLEKVPKWEFIMEEKLDWYLWILFHTNNQWIFSTKGSFTWELVEEFKNIFEKKYKTSDLDIYRSYVFEVCSDKEQIVLKYPENKIVLLSTFEGHEEIWIWEADEKFLTPKIFNYTSFEEVKKLDINWEEWVVVRFTNWFRMKIKFENYFEKHKIVSNINEKNIFENIYKWVKLDKLIIWMPDEAFNEITNIYNSLILEIKEYENLVNCEFSKFKNKLDQKSFALAIKDNEFKWALFAIKSWKFNLYDFFKKYKF